MHVECTSSCLVLFVLAELIRSASQVYQATLARSGEFKLGWFICTVTLGVNFVNHFAKQMYAPQN